MINFAQSYFATPKLENAAIQRMRIMFQQQTFVQYCMHLVERLDDEQGNEWPYFKMLTGRDREQRLMPDSKMKSLMFFEMVNANYSSYPGELSRYNINLYFWFNKDKNILQDKEDVTDEYLKLTLDILRTFFRVENIERSTNRNDVFDFSGYSEHNAKLVLGKFGGFKINCDLYHDDYSCYNITDMTTAIPISDSGTFTASNLVDGVLTIDHSCNSTTILSITINKANGEIITVMPNEIVNINTITIDLGGIEVGTHTWTVTAKPMLI